MTKIFDDVPARMSLEDDKKVNEVLPQFDNEMWFLSILDSKQVVAVQLAYTYAKMNWPDVAGAEYKTIYTLSELLRQIDVEIETDDND